MVPGLDVNFSQPIRDNVNENIYGQMGQIALKIFYNDLKELQATAEGAKAAIAQVRGVADLAIVKSAEVPQLQIVPRRDLLGRFGLTMADVQHFITVAIGGSPVGTLWEGERNFDIVLRLPEAARDTIEKIAALRMPTKAGALPLKAFDSMALALLVLLNVPFALVGGALGLWLVDMPVSVAAAVGFIALVGQASLNGVLAALGLIPAAFSRAIGSETQRPIAVVIVGGTLSAALQTLIVLPVMYKLLLERLKERGSLDHKAPESGTESLPPP